MDEFFNMLGIIAFLAFVWWVVSILIVVVWNTAFKKVDDWFSWIVPVGLWTATYGIASVLGLGYYIGKLIGG